MATSDFPGIAPDELLDLEGWDDGPVDMGPPDDTPTFDKGHTDPRPATREIPPGNQVGQQTEPRPVAKDMPLGNQAGQQDADPRPADHVSAPGEDRVGQQNAHPRPADQSSPRVNNEVGRRKVTSTPDAPSDPTESGAGHEPSLDPGYAQGEGSQDGNGSEDEPMFPGEDFNGTRRPSGSGQSIDPASDPPEATTEPPGPEAMPSPPSTPPARPPESRTDVDERPADARADVLAYTLKVQRYVNH